MRNIAKIVLVFLFILAASLLKAQSVTNPSFEDTPGDGKAAAGWRVCDLSPDVQPAPATLVVKSASDGNTYMGSVSTGEFGNNVSESYGQLLPQNLFSGQQYVWEVDLSYSPAYNNVAGNPGRLAIYGGSGQCHEEELLWVSPIMQSTDWIKYLIEFTPSKDFSFLTFKSAREDIPANILVDNLIAPLQASNKPKSGFYASSYCVDMPTKFTNTSVAKPGNSIVSYHWDFDYNNQTSSSENPEFTYPVFGNYDVKLVVTDNEGFKDSTTQTLQVRTFDFRKGPDASICDNDSAQIRAVGAAHYTWTPSTGLSNPNIFNPNASPNATTTYKCVGINESGCADSVAVIVSVKPSAAAVINGPHVACAGDFVHMVATGGDNYRWYNPQGDEISTSSNGIIIGFSAADTGHYQLVALSDNGCHDTAYHHLGIFTTEMLSIEGENNFCEGDTLIWVAKGGSSYTWTNNNGTVLSSKDSLVLPDITAEQAGNYSVEIAADGGQCAQTLSMDLEVLPAPTVNFTGDTLVCHGDALGLNASGANSYLWQNAISGIEISSTSMLSLATMDSSSADTLVLLTGANNLGCSSSKNIQLGHHPVISDFGVNFNNNGCDYYGDLSISPSGGTAPFEFNVNGQGYVSNNTFQDIIAQQISIFIRDANTCAVDSVFEFYEESADTAYISVAAANCGQSNGRIRVDSIVGQYNDINPFQSDTLYSLDGGTYQRSNEFSGVSAGTHLLRVKNYSGCTYQQNVLVPSVSGPNNFHAEINGANCGQQNGSLALQNVTGGNSPYEYSNGGVSYQSSNLFSFLAAGSYEMYVRDTEGCVFSRMVHVPELAAQFSADIITQPEGCESLDDGSIQSANVGGGNPPYQYSLNGISYQNLPIGALDSGSYNLHIKDATGCISVHSVFIDQEPRIRSVSVGITPDTCGKQIGTIQVAAVIGANAVQFTFNGTSNASGNFNALSTSTNNLRIADENGCFYDTLITIPERTYLSELWIVAAITCT